MRITFAHEGETKLQPIRPMQLPRKVRQRYKHQLGIFEAGLRQARLLDQCPEQDQPSASFSALDHPRPAFRPRPRSIKTVARLNEKPLLPCQHLATCQHGFWTHRERSVLQERPRRK